MPEKSLAEKLQVKDGRRLVVVGQPAGLDLALGPDVPMADAVADAEVVLAFARSVAELERTLPDLATRLAPGAILWLGYPKLGTALASDIQRDVIHGFAPKAGFDCVAQIAIDATWSALRLKRLG
jgi:hypothetical protein